MAYIEKGILKHKSGRFGVYIALPSRYNNRKNGYNFCIGTVDTIEQAREVRKIAEELKENDEFGELERMKTLLSKKALTKKSMIIALNRILKNHDSVYGDYTIKEHGPDEYYDLEQIQEWKHERGALIYAIKQLEM